MDRVQWGVRLAAAVLCGVCCAGMAAEKEAALPKDLPAYGPLPAVSTPVVKVEKLPNGMTLWLVPRPGFPKLAFVFAVRGGTAADPRQRPGLSELLVNTLHQGTATRNAMPCHRRAMVDARSAITASAAMPPQAVPISIATASPSRMASLVRSIPLCSLNTWCAWDRVALLAAIG